GLIARRQLDRGARRFAQRSPGADSLPRAGDRLCDPAACGRALRGDFQRRISRCDAGPGGGVLPRRSRPRRRVDRAASQVKRKKSKVRSVVGAVLPFYFLPLTSERSMRIAITTLGCKINQYDSAVIQSRLEERHSLVPFD